MFYSIGALAVVALFLHLMVNDSSPTVPLVPLQGVQDQLDFIRQSIVDYVKNASSPLYRSKDLSGWLMRSHYIEPGLNVTLDFLRFYNVAESRASGHAVAAVDVSEFAGLSVVVVQGIFTEFYPGYMSSTMSTLIRDLGSDRVYLALTDSVVSSVRAAHQVRDTIELAARSRNSSVVVLGHSKGGVDVHTALVLFPHLVPLVRAVVLLQTPLGGTPVTTDLLAAVRSVQLPLPFHLEL
jgi:hypothetical protein